MKRPFKTYNGGKAGNGTYQQIISHIPKCDIFIDAMVGNGGIFTNMQLPGVTVINDIDRSVIDGYKLIVNDGLIVFNLDYKSLVATLPNTAGIKRFFYFDPPYLKETRRNSKDLYAFEWNTQDHIEFLELAINIRDSVMISHYPCELYDKMLKGWHTHDFLSMTRRGLATERIYMNYPKPYVLQDFRYLGSDYRERQRIKRKTSRWLNKLEAMPEDERTAILSSMIVRYGNTAGEIIGKTSHLLDIAAPITPMPAQPQNQL